MSGNAILLPSCFPTSPKECRKLAENFFTCYDQNSKKENDMDTTAGYKGLEKCVNQMKQYESCVSQIEKKKEPRRFRVQEEYRNK